MWLLERVNFLSIRFKSFCICMNLTSVAVGFSKGINHNRKHDMMKIQPLLWLKIFYFAYFLILCIFSVEKVKLILSLIN
jgi:hypothetical protein